MPNLAYLSLGSNLSLKSNLVSSNLLKSNLGGREAQLREAQTRLSVAGSIAAASSLYETEPVEYTEQPWFLNCAVLLETTLSPQELMSAILNIEEQMGRRRLVKKGPRSIDIDILLFGDVVLKSDALTIPHPEMHRRRFVLEPLAEIAPEVVHPVLHKSIRELLAALPEGQIVRRA
jgi:2-amino-4-hydroxy-6-hydroxymethyldihydropteridine diphosphokinase